jgi:hypothetical protein
MGATALYDPLTSKRKMLANRRSPYMGEELVQFGLNAFAQTGEQDGHQRG